MDIKPIETVYKGYRFRSRLEARWAVFFDEAGIEWEYEPEGFMMEDGTKYLPDFRVKTKTTWGSTYVEIKPLIDTSEVKERGLDKPRRFFSSGHGTLIVLFGEPGGYFIEKTSKYLSPWSDNVLRYETNTELLYLYLGLIDFEQFKIINSTLVNTENAALEARSSRFEFGENR